MYNNTKIIEKKGLKPNSFRNFSIILHLLSHSVPEIQNHYVTVSTEWKEMQHKLLYIWKDNTYN